MIWGIDVNLSLRNTRQWGRNEDCWPLIVDKRVAGWDSITLSRKSWGWSFVFCCCFWFRLGVSWPAIISKFISVVLQYCCCLHRLTQTPLRALLALLTLQLTRRYQSLPLYCHLKAVFWKLNKTRIGRKTHKLKALSPHLHGLLSKCWVFILFPTSVKFEKASISVPTAETFLFVYLAPFSQYNCCLCQIVLKRPRDLLKSA